MRVTSCKALYAGLALLLSMFVATASQATLPDECPNRVVGLDELRSVIASIEGYDITVTTNQGRFVADVLLGLASSSEQSEEHRRPFEIDPEDFFQAVVDVAGIAPEEMPVSFHRARTVGQVFVVDGHAVRLILAGDNNVRQALAVAVRWPKDGPDYYEYEDSMARPELLVRYQREVSYRLVVLDDRIVYDDIEGLSGRPTSGALGALFRLLGRARIESSHYAIAEDDTVVAYTRGRRLFPFSILNTLWPDGTTLRGVPEDRPDLIALGEKLERTPSFTNEVIDQ